MKKVVEKAKKIYSKFITSKYSLYMMPFLTVAVLSLIFIYTSLSWLVFIALLPLLIFINQVKNGGGSKIKSILTIWLSGFLFFLIAQIWMLLIDTSSWAAVEGASALVALSFCWIYVSFAYSFAFLIFGWASIKLPFKLTSWISVLIVPSIWVVGEFVRSYLYSIFTWGPEAIIGAHWNFANLGFAAIDTPLGFASRIVGLFGLSFIVVAINIALFNLIYKKYTRSLIIILTCFLIALFGSSFFNSKQPSISIAYVQLKEYSTDYGPRLIEIIKSSSKNTTPDILVLPEESQFHLLSPTERSEITEAVFGNSNGYIITTAFSNTPSGRQIPVLQYFDTKGRIISTQQKNFLIPVGEYLPLALETVMNISGNSEAITAHKQTRLHKRGEKPESPVYINETSIGALACSGVLSPYLYRDLANQGAEVFVNSAALDIFAKSDIYYDQTQNIVRFQAIANGRPFVHSAMGGDSYILDSRGNYLTYSKPRELAYRVSNITPSSRQTIYTKLGEYFVPLSLLLLLGFYLNKKFNFMKKLS